MANVAEHYTYRVFWSPEDGEYVGAVAEMPLLSHLNTDRLAAFVGIQELAAAVVDDMLANSETPPEALSDKHYSGKFVVRVPEQVHRRLAVTAAEQGISLNALAASQLANAS